MPKSGISQVGGKNRSRKRLLSFTPIHKFFLSEFCGACHYELDKPRADNYECFNDANGEYINYLEVTEFYPEEFEKRKEGVLGLYSRQVYDDIKSGFLKPRDRIDRAVMFQYLVKLGHGSRVNFRGMVPETTSKKENIEKAKDEFQHEISSRFKGYNPKYTRPYTNNDCGILTKIDPETIERLHYVILESLDFMVIDKKFHDSFYARKGLTKECFIYKDPPYPGFEQYYGDLFLEDRHFDLIESSLNSPFNIMTSIGGECKIYLDIFREAEWIIEPVKVKYSTDANLQSETEEYFIMNYRIKGAKYLSKELSKEKPYLNYNPDPPEFPLMKKKNKKEIKYADLNNFIHEGV